MSKVSPHTDALHEETRSALPVADSHATPPGSPLSSSPPKPTGTINRAKLRIRRGSRRVVQMFDPKANSELQLDLDRFYTARLRRRTHLEEEISGTLERGGVDIESGDDAMSPAKSRSIMMTLSPGEEYENYQKVHQANKIQQSALVVAAVIDNEDGIPEEDEKEVEAEGPIGTSSRSLERGISGASSGSVPDGKQAKTQSGTMAPVYVDPLRKNAANIGLPMDNPTLRRLAKRNSFRTQAKVFTTSKKMINPQGRLRLTWDTLSILFILYNAFVLPFRASFDPFDQTQDGFDIFLDQFFIFDMLVTFNTAVDVDGSIQYSRRAAAKVYLKGWFIVDVIAAIPYDDILPQTSVAANSSLRHSLKLLRLVRLLRLFRISRIFRRIRNAIFIRSTLTALFKYILMVMFVSHWFSCIFHAIAANHKGPNNWITINHLQDPSGDKWDRYVAALYFAVMTLATIGFGDISGTNADERLFSIFAMIIGGGIFAYGITNIVELVSSLTIAETRFRSKMDEVNEYMAARELPMKLRIEIREFFHNTRISRESRLNGEQQILGELSSKLRSKIALSINDQFLRKFPFFAGSDPNFLLELALNMRMIHFAPLEDVIIEGEIGHEMFFIFRGAVEVLRNGSQIGILGENQYFGEMAILSPDNRRRATVRTLCFCELRMLSRNRFLEALALFPAMQAKMAQVARARLQPKPPTPTKSSPSKTTPTRDKPPMSPTTVLLPEPTLSVVKGQPPGQSTAKLPISPSQKLLANSGRQHSGFRMATTAARLNTVVRRPTVAPTDGGISVEMAQMLTEVNSKVEEATRRHEMLVTQIMKMQTDLERLVPID